MKDKQVIEEQLKDVKNNTKQKEACSVEEEPKEPKYVQMSLEDFGIVIE